MAKKRLTCRCHEESDFNALLGRVVAAVCALRGSSQHVSKTLLTPPCFVGADRLTSAAAFNERRAFWTASRQPAAEPPILFIGYLQFCHTPSDVESDFLLARSFFSMTSWVFKHGAGSVSAS
jgi:hypothetical protein